MAFIDYYKILQVDRCASDKIIQAAFRAFAKQYHPDTNPGDPTAEEKFKTIHEAYETLGDPIKREEYNKVYDEHYAPPQRAYQQQRSAPPPPNPLVCPRCGRVDHVQQVSSLVASQTLSGTSTSYGFVGEMQAQLFSSSHSQTLLSRRLSPPKAPRYHNPWLWMLLGLPFLCSASIDATALMIGIGLAVALAIWCSHEVPRRRAKYNAEFPFFNKAMAKWRQLYYCQRDDGVFVPGHGARFIPADAMMQYLYEP